MDANTATTIVMIGSSAAVMGLALLKDAQDRHSVRKIEAEKDAIASEKAAMREGFEREMAALDAAELRIVQGGPWA